MLPSLEMASLYALTKIKSSQCLVNFTNSVAAQTIIFVPVPQKLVLSTNICVLPMMFAATRTHNRAEAFPKKLVTVTIWRVIMPIANPSIEPPYADLLSVSRSSVLMLLCVEHSE